MKPNNTVNLDNNDLDINDKYAIPIYRALGHDATFSGFASKEGQPEPNPTVKGETENHSEQRMVGIYAESPSSTRRALVRFYGDDLLQRGNQGGECLLAVSHFSHYGAARVPALLFSLKAGHDDLTSIMVNVLKADYASLRMVSNPTMTDYACPCSRLLDGADQREQVIRTAQWLNGKKVRMPKTLAVAPDWLALYAYTLIDAAYRRGDSWAKQWPAIRKSIVSATESDILPLKFPLTVEKSRHGHVAYFNNPSQRLGKDGSLWAKMDYNSPVVEYGVLNPDAKHSLKNVVLKPFADRPACPGGVETVYQFPVAGTKR